MELHEFHRDVMRHPQMYVVFRGPEYVCETDHVGAFANDPKYNVWVDMRHAARMRLYDYLLKKCGVLETKYDPFGGDKEIGVSKPILNF